MSDRMKLRRAWNIRGLQPVCDQAQNLYIRLVGVVEPRRINELDVEIASLRALKCTTLISVVHDSKLWPMMSSPPVTVSMNYAVLIGGILFPME
jgi:hypothetical protein